MISKGKPKFSKSEVEHIARLAGLDLSGEEKEKFRDQLSETIRRADKLRDIETAGIEITASINNEANVLREDVVISPLTQSEALQNASIRQGEYFLSQGLR